MDIIDFIMAFRIEFWLGYLGILIIIAYAAHQGRKYREKYGEP
jgi:hypothetical protein